MIHLSVILPVQNQETIIEPVVNEIKKILKVLKINYEIICVENESTDGTYKVLTQISKKDSKIKTIIAAKGYGSAIIEGLKTATGSYVCYLPSDGQIKPDLIAYIYKIILTGKYDLVKIRRTTRESLIRKFRSKIFNYLMRTLFKISVQDINGSPRIFLRKWLPVLNLKYKDSYIDSEMAIKAYRLKWKIKEIPTITLPRKGGKSTVRIKTIIEFLRNMLVSRLII